jgi:4-hydroxy-tetrahydrodipicolinate synthase
MDDQALEFFAWGASGWVCAGSNFAPEAHVALYEACRVEGEFLSKVENLSNVSSTDQL